MGDRWICDRVPTERFPDYTRGNAGEVMSDPVSPLAWTFCWEPGGIKGCVDGFEQMGVFDAIDFRPRLEERLESERCFIGQGPSGVLEAVLGQVAHREA